MQVKLNISAAVKAHIIAGLKNAKYSSFIEKPNNREYFQYRLPSFFFGHKCIKDIFHFTQAAIFSFLITSLWNGFLDLALKPSYVHICCKRWTQTCE